MQKLLEKEALKQLLQRAQQKKQLLKKVQKKHQLKKLQKNFQEKKHQLKKKQKKQLLKLLLKGAMANGYQTELWTTARIAEIIQKTFGITYHRDHIGRLMASLGWSYQKPEKRALQRDEQAIEEWRRTHWPRVKKTLCGWVPI